MDLDLTGQIWGMQVSLIGEVTQDIKITDWLPLLAVPLTAFFTYYITTTTQEWKHRKELKRHVYFELIDVITKARKVYEDNQRNPVVEDPAKQTSEDRDRIDREMMIPYAFQAAKFKAYAVGSKEFNKLIDTQIRDKDPIRGTNQEYQTFLKSLIAQMEQELVERTSIEKVSYYLGKCKTRFAVLLIRLGIQ